jgi:hypothetical protein
MVGAFKRFASIAAAAFDSMDPSTREFREATPKARALCVKMIQHAKRFERAEMKREVALKIALALVGWLFLALAYPAIIFARQDPALSMMFSIYVTLGIFLLIAIRNPWASRSLIAFTAWSSLVHAAVMGTQAMRDMVSRNELVGVAVLIVIGAALIALAPAQQRVVPAVG